MKNSLGGADGYQDFQERKSLHSLVSCPEVSAKASAHTAEEYMSLPNTGTEDWPEVERHTQHQASPGQYKAAGWDTGIKFLQKERMTGFRRCYLINELLMYKVWLEYAGHYGQIFDWYVFPPWFLSVSQASWPPVGWGLALPGLSTMMITSV